MTNKTTPAQDTNLVAVYGSLKKGFGNHGVMTRAEGKFIKEGFVEFQKLSGGGFPIVLFEKEYVESLSGKESPDAVPKFIKVELYEVAREGVMGPLDSLEGHPTFYRRINVTTEEGDEVTIYQYQSDFEDRSEEWRILPDQTNPSYYEWNK